MPDPELTPLEQGARDGRGCVWALAGALAGLLGLAALGTWGGTAGRVVVAALGFGVAGAVLPFQLADGRGNDSGGAFLILVVVGVLIGLGFGAWFGTTDREWPVWVPLAAAAATTLGGALLARRLTRSGPRAVE